MGIMATYLPLLTESRKRMWTMRHEKSAVQNKFQNLSHRSEMIFNHNMKTTPTTIQLDDIIFNSEQAATFLSISRAVLMNLVSDGRIPYFKLGRSNRYLRSELAQMILEQRRGPRIYGHQER